MGLQNARAIKRGGNPACNGSETCGTFGGQHLDASSRVIEWNSLDLRMAGKKLVALSESHRVGIDALKIAQGGSRKSYQIMNDPQIDFGHNVQIVIQQQIIDFIDRAGEGALNERKTARSIAFHHADRRS